MRATLVLLACGCGGAPAIPTVSDHCITDAVAYNRKISEEFRRPAPKPDTPPPLEVKRELVEGRRIAGTTAILPDESTLVEMRRRGVVETTASFRLCLGTDGVPTEVRRLSSTCFPRYDERMRKTIETWRYSPYSVDGIPKDVCTEIRFLYRVRRR